MTTEEVFEEMREIVAEKRQIFMVYKHTDPEGKVYIGYCCGDLKKRWKSGSGYHTNKRFHEAIKIKCTPSQVQNSFHLLP